VRASLADQDHGRTQQLAAAVSQALVRPDTLAIALGANLPSRAGSPADTLLTLRPLLEQVLQQWQLWQQAPLRFHWSPLLETAPVGGPAGQSNYVNGALLVEGCRLLFEPSCSGAPQAQAALALLQALQQLEAQFGRPPQSKRQHWGPRSLDLDLLWWGDLELDLPATSATPALQLPHPLWRERLFVLEPLMSLISAG
jgi:2-amino-4-hydroxy-6-hydroxymethyldihydropteridine diphosphokinase